MAVMFSFAGLFSGKGASPKEEPLRQKEKKATTLPLAGFFSNLIIGHPAEGRKEFAATVAFLIEHAHLFTEAPTSSLLIVQKNTPIWRAIDYWGIEMQDGDALGWWLKDGSNTLAERKRRAQVMDFFYESMFGTGIKITDMDTERDLTLGDDDVIPRTAQAN